MAEWICEQCQTGFSRPRSGKRPTRFCSQECYHLWRKDNNISLGQFKKGHIPWNKDKRGIRLSPKTEFKQGSKPPNYCHVGTIRIRKSKNGVKRAWVKTKDPNVWKLRCLSVWEKHYGKLPRGLLIHHIDKNPLNDEISNLAAISRAVHLKIHKPDFEDKRLEAIKKKALSRKRNS